MRERFICWRILLLRVISWSLLFVWWLYQWAFLCILVNGFTMQGTAFWSCYDLLRRCRNLYMPFLYIYEYSLFFNLWDTALLFTPHYKRATPRLIVGSLVLYSWSDNSLLLYWWSVLSLQMKSKYLSFWSIRLSAGSVLGNKQNSPTIFLNMSTTLYWRFQLFLNWPFSLLALCFLSVVMTKYRSLN